MAIDPPTDLRSIASLVDIMAALRNPDGGCPWDLEQTYDTIAPYTIEEAYEVFDAIERKDFPHLKDELGDLLFQAVYHAQMAAEDRHFDFGDVVANVCKKMIRRHPPCLWRRRGANLQKPDRRLGRYQGGRACRQR